MCGFFFNSSVFCYRSSKQRQREVRTSDLCSCPEIDSFSFNKLVDSDKLYKNQSYLKMNMKNEICIGDRKMNRAKIHLDYLMK